jgi:hypothetical protein
MVSQGVSMLWSAFTAPKKVRSVVPSPFLNPVDPN